MKRVIVRLGTDLGKDGVTESTKKEKGLRFMVYPRHVHIK